MFELKINFKFTTVLCTVSRVFCVKISTCLRARSITFRTDWEVWVVPSCPETKPIPDQAVKMCHDRAVPSGWKEGVRGKVVSNSLATCTSCILTRFNAAVNYNISDANCSSAREPAA